MLSKMRRRFIASAMAAMGAVTLVLLVAVNLWNYTITTDRLDDTIDALMNHRAGAVLGLIELHSAGHIRKRLAGDKIHDALLCRGV